MPQHETPTRTVWAELWEANPTLYTALQLTTTINTTLLHLLLITTLSTAFNALCVWTGRRRRQNPTYNYNSNSNYSIFNGSVETAPYGIVSQLARTRSRALEIVYAKAAFHISLYLCVQYAITRLITQVSRILASTSLGDGNQRRQCARLLERGLECEAAMRFHDPLLLLAAGVVLCTIRGLRLHVELPIRPARDSRFSPGFLRLRAALRRVLQAVLAVPVTLVWLSTHGGPRDAWWKKGRLLGVQACASLGVFLVGNVVCAVAALPDFQGTMQKLHASGITYRKGV